MGQIIKRHKPVTNEEKEKKSESTELTRQIRLTRQTWDSHHESLITKQIKKIDGSNEKKLTN